MMRKKKMEEVSKQTDKKVSEMDYTERFFMKVAANQQEGSRASNPPPGQTQGQHRLKQGKGIT